MATTATIQIESFKTAVLYKHWDGNPESTLKWLEDFNNDFIKNRGNDPEYKFAQLVRSSIRDAKKYGLDDSKYTGWGVFGFDQVDCEYRYRLMNNGEVEVKRNY